ncbi:hypothetical protein M758_11G135800 [Ceratodon purpureus]|uniref:Uncharacterized protein n=1 Tax=Ceratodon purpureus TaxID=3225 RepID=A0A8T0GG85_CERPU|nr:hypothetical protein KC19_11G140000 [Ceratodon purpureus]KAG0601730.1 hypothetical protein M758_11G135800 [Ceratodon purpureus]
MQLEILGYEYMVSGRRGSYSELFKLTGLSRLSCYGSFPYRSGRWDFLTEFPHQDFCLLTRSFAEIERRVRGIMGMVTWPDLQQRASAFYICFFVSISVRFSKFLTEY